MAVEQLLRKRIWVKQKNMNFTIRAPRNQHEGTLKTVMRSKSKKLKCSVKEVVGKPVGRVQHFLNKTFFWLLQEGKVQSVYGDSIYFFSSKLVCLSHEHSKTPPSSVFDMTGLSNCGRGPGLITLDVQQHSFSFHNLLERQLFTASGWWLWILPLSMRGQEYFHNILPPYTLAKVMELAGQAQVYIPPLQKDLDDLQENSLPYSEIKQLGFFRKDSFLMRSCGK